MWRAGRRDQRIPLPHHAFCRASRARKYCCVGLCRPRLQVRLQGTDEPPCLCTQLAQLLLGQHDVAAVLACGLQRLPKCSKAALHASHHLANAFICRRAR